MDLLSAFSAKGSILIVVLGFTTLAMLPGATIGLAPGTPCPDPTQPCTAFPSTASTAISRADPTFNLASDPGIVMLGQFVVPGDVVLFETTPGSLSDKTTWSDVVEFSNVFSPTGAGQSIATTFPDAEPVGILLPPGFTLSANAVGLPETPVGIGTDAHDFTVYTAGTNIYQIHSDSPCCELPEPMEGTAEPSTMGLLGLGLAGVYALGKIRKR